MHFCMRGCLRAFLRAWTAVCSAEPTLLLNRPTWLPFALAWCDVSWCQPCWKLKIKVFVHYGNYFVCLIFTLEDNFINLLDKLILFQWILTLKKIQAFWLVLIASVKAAVKEKRTLCGSHVGPFRDKVGSALVRDDPFFVIYDHSRSFC